jgi:hypothetical protein
MRWLIVRAAMVALALAGTTGAAKAGWTTNVGSATFVDGASGTKGTVDFAVWKNSGSTTLLSELNTALGLTGANAYTASNNPFGASATTPATTYLYFYEVVNTGSPKLNTFTLGTDISKVIDAGVAPSSAKNNVFNSVPTGGPPTFTSSTTASAWAFDGSASDTQIDFSASGSNLATNANTTLMIVASNGAPKNEKSLLNSPTGTSASGSVPVPTPEPGTIALLGLALPIFGWGYMRRLRRNRALATVAAQ